MQVRKHNRISGIRTTLRERSSGGDVAYLGAAATFLTVIDLRFLVGLVIVLLLLFLLLGMRMTIRLTRTKTRQSLARLAELEEQEAPEWDPSAPKPVARTSARPTPPVAQPTQSTKPDMSPLYQELSETAKIRYTPTQADAELAEGEFNYKKAASLWARLARWKDAGRCQQKSGNLFEAAEIYLALGNEAEAMPLLRESLAQNPTDEKIRLRLIEALFDRGENEAALDLIRAVAKNDDSQGASAEFLAKAGRRLEAAHMLDEAEVIYRLSVAKDDGQVEVHARILFIKQLRRLIELGTQGGNNSPARELLDKYMMESTGLVPPSMRGIVANNPALEGHEVIVGHLALGFQKPEPPYSVRSKFSISRRFTLENMLSESERCTVFTARDRLLDAPVALKLYRLNSDFNDLELLRERLLAIAQLNHPNLAKLTFVDREGPIIRIATEFLPGGNLIEYLTKLGGVGLPLILRMALHISSALHSAHSRGVPHGDLRPENLIIGPDQRIKLVDFALSTTPVRVADDPDLDISDSQKGSSSDFRANVAVTEAVVGDILQFADVLQFMLDHSRQSADPAQSAGVADAIRELQDLVENTRGGAFTSILGLWQILHEIFERNMPASSRVEQRKV